MSTAPKAGATVTQLMVASTRRWASIGASVAGSALMTLILAGSMPLRCSTTGHSALEDENVGMATVLPSMSLSDWILLSARVNSASGWLE
ncbi:hypothetical protein D3C71_1622370 [compost metagenome]